MLERNWYQDYMTGGERVMWESEAEKHRWTVHSADVAMLLVMLAAGLWGGYLLYLVLSAQNVPVQVCIFWVIMAGLWLMLAAREFLGPWVRRHWGQRHARYVVTDRRILRWRSGWVDSMLLSQLPEPVLVEEKNGRGTLRFWPQAAENTACGIGQANLGSMAGFELRQIARAEEVRRLLREKGKRPERPAAVHEEPFFPLEKGERLLWQGCPDRQRAWRSGDRSRLPGALWVTTLTVSFDLLVVSLVGSHPDMWILHAMLLGIGAVGAASFLIPFRRSVQRIRRTRYMLTDRRAVMQAGGRESEKRLDGGDAPYVYLAQGRGGTATLMLAHLSKGWNAHAAFTSGEGMQPWHEPAPDSARYTSGFTGFGFLMLHIPDAAEVADRIEAVLRKEGARG